MLCGRDIGCSRQVTDLPPGRVISSWRGEAAPDCRLLIEASESGTRATAPTVPGRIPKLSLLGAAPEVAPNSLAGGDFFCCAAASLAPPARTKASATCKPRTLDIVQTIWLLLFNRMLAGPARKCHVTRNISGARSEVDSWSVASW